MNPRTLVADRQGIIAKPFQRHLASLTTVSVRGDLQVAEARSGVSTDEFSRFWQSAFGRALRNERIVAGGLPTKYLLDELRGIE